MKVEFIDNTLLEKLEHLDLKREYIAPQLFALNQANIEGGNTSNNAENSGGVWASHS